MPKILIVEDEASQRRALRESLAQKGFSILEAMDGVKGLGVALREHPDIILLDIRMPMMDGMTMMHKLRKDAWGKKAAVIILTNYDTNDNKLFQITIDRPSYYLIKSNSPIEQILEKIQELLEANKKEMKDAA